MEQHGRQTPAIVAAARNTRPVALVGLWVRQACEDGRKRAGGLPSLAYGPSLPPSINRQSIRELDGSSLTLDLRRCPN